MSTTEQALISFFEQVAQRDSAQLKKLESEQSFSVTNERWCFTLPDLYTFLRYQNKIFHHTDYKQFIQLIFSCLINQTIKLYGAEITIIKNLGKVDKSSYALIWKNTLE